MQTSIDYFNNKRGNFSARAVINQIKVNSLPSFVFDTGQSEIIPYGVDNLYPNRIYEAVYKSPTASGCVKRLNEFIFGEGIIIGGNFQVNRYGQTLNDVLRFAIKSYSIYKGFALHFNFNIFGDIIEIVHVDFRFIRKLKNLNQIKIDNFHRDANNFMIGDHEDIIIDLYDPEFVANLAKKNHKAFKEYKGQIYYWCEDDSIYPSSLLDAASISASYENEAQIYPYANIKNGFSGNTIIKLPTYGQGEDTEEDFDSTPVGKVKKELQEMHGSDKSGSSLVINAPINAQGEAKPFQMIEHLSPTNVDDLFTNQNAKAENNILKVYTMPKILLGVNDTGMFNEASFNDAFNYKNSDAEGDRKKIERAFNGFLPNSIYPMNSVEIKPLNMRESKQNGI